MSKVSELCAGLSLAEIARSPDPFVHYKALRDHGDVFYWERDDCFLVTGHELVRQVMSDHENFSSSRGVLMEEDQSAGGLNLPLFMMSPPEQTRARILAADAFSMQRNRRQWTEYCREADALMGALRTRGPELDIVEDYAIDVATDCLWSMLGVPHPERALVRRLMRSMVIRSGDGGHAVDPGVLAAGKQSMLDLMARRIEDSRARPDDSFVSALVNAERDGDRFSEGEVLSLLHLGLFGGFEDVIRMIAASAEILSDEPAELQRLRLGGADAARKFAAEAIRFTSSTHVMRRTSTREVALGGIVIPPDRRVVTLIAGCNRDPRAFVDPDRFDVGRKNARNAMTFGSGPHVCIGQHVARELIAAAVLALANATTRIVVDKARRLRVFGNNIGGYASLPARLSWELAFA